MLWWVADNKTLAGYIPVAQLASNTLIIDGLPYGYDVGEVSNY